MQPIKRLPTVVKEAGDLTPAVLQNILQQSLKNAAIHVTQVQNPMGLGGMNDQYGSELTKIVVTMEEDGKTKRLRLVVKASLQSTDAWGAVIFGLLPFCREVFWFDTALPKLQSLVNVEQAASLADIVPKVHYAYCNYKEGDRQGCLIGNGLASSLACCCCVLATKPKEKGIIVMENLKEGNGDTYVDLKQIECTSGGGVKSVHMRMILVALAHFHGAWMVWLRKGVGIGDLTRSQVLKFFKHKKVLQHKWYWKVHLKKFMSYYISLAEAKNMQGIKERVQKFIDHPTSVDSILYAFNYKDTNFETVCHSDLWSSQIMLSLHEDGKSFKKAFTS